MARLVDASVTKLVWVPGAQSVITNIKAPTLAQLSGAGVKDITCLVVTNYEVRADGSDTTDESAVCDAAAGTAPTKRKYTGNLILFRDYLATGLPGTDDPLATFDDTYPQGYFVRRIGKPYDAAFAASDVVDLYHFTADTPQIQGGTGEGFLKVTVPLLPTGRFSVKSTVAGP